jgi:hypothetical protein
MTAQSCACVARAYSDAAGGLVADRFLGRTAPLPTPAPTSQIGDKLFVASTRSLARHGRIPMNAGNEQKVDRLRTRREVADRLRVSVRTIARLEKAGKLQRVKNISPTLVFFRESDIERLIKGNN